MKSTGEVMGVDSAFAPALRKAMMAAGVSLPPEGGVLLSIADRDKAEAELIIRALGDAGYRLYATAGTAALVRRLGYDVTAVGKADRRRSDHHQPDPGWAGLTWSSTPSPVADRRCKTASKSGEPPPSIRYRA